MMIDQKIRDQLILCREVLARHQDSPHPPPAQLLQDLIICHGIAELALAALCLQLDCVPDKKEIGIQDYFRSLARFSSPVLPMAGSDFVAALDHARGESHLRMHLPIPEFWIGIRQMTLKNVSDWCQQTLNIDFSKLANANCGGSRESVLGTFRRSPGQAPDSGSAPVNARYPCAGSVEIRLSRWGRSEKGTIANLSIGGCNIRSDFTFEVEEKIEMMLEVNGTRFRVAGRVAHVPPLHLPGSKGNGIGVRFENMTAGAVIRLKDLIKEMDVKALRRKTI